MIGNESRVEMKLLHKAPQPVSYCILPSHFKGRDVPDWAMGDPDLRQTIDTHTLFYDLFAGEDPTKVVAVGPPLRQTMRRFIKDAIITLDGSAVTVTEVSQTKRSCTLEFVSEVPHPTELIITHPQMSFRQTVGPSQLKDYSGKRALFTLSRDNDLAWIRDWAQFHVETQGVNAIILFDNASTKYGTSEILETLDGIAGLDVFDVVSMPFAFGPPGASREHHRHRYLQFAVLEIARRRFLRQASGVLNMDIDELAYGPTGRTVFDQLAAQKKGFLTLNGVWRYAMTDTQICHASHVLRKAEKEQPMYPKWCLDPQGPVKDLAWRIHGLKGLADHECAGLGFLHCRSISNNWSYDRTHNSSESLVPDPLAQSVFASSTI